jgi:hypothetical protein
MADPTVAHGCLPNAGPTHCSSCVLSRLWPTGARCGSSLVAHITARLTLAHMHDAFYAG